MLDDHPGEQQSARVKSPRFGPFRSSKHAKVFRPNVLDGSYTGLDNQPAVARDFIAAFCQKFGGTDSVMPEKPVHTMRILVSRAVVMKRKSSAKVASQE